ncbi:MAG: hypothetical protein CBB87_00510 [Micavibrio sp. TMED27]|nr:hypothetical protein [Micavibrio sp.]OUT92956.1 MAG: hypothetical protein CBB87_00510 [Micavibrio sp. TMED27]|tara:strand:- start:303 stop:782 length:480 start_codon:yes stop_codon:yes gene_type:complete
MTFSFRKQTLVLTALATLAVPAVAFAQDAQGEPAYDGSRLQERWQGIYDQASPEQQEKMDQKKSDFQDMSPEDQKALIRDHRENRADRRENKRDRAENKFDRREDIYDKRHDGGVRDKVEDRYDRREDIRDRKENRFDRKENRLDRKFKGGKPRFQGNE